jgi:hypothetical protein
MQRHSMNAADLTPESRRGILRHARFATPAHPRLPHSGRCEGTRNTVESPSAGVAQGETQNHVPRPRQTHHYNPTTDTKSRTAITTRAATLSVSSRWSRPCSQDCSALAEPAADSPHVGIRGSAAAIAVTRSDHRQSAVVPCRVNVAVPPTSARLLSFCSHQPASFENAKTPGP